MNIHHCVFKILEKKTTKCHGRTDIPTDNLKTVSTNKVCRVDLVLQAEYFLVNLLENGVISCILSER